MGLGNAIFLLVLLNIIYSVYSLKSELRQRKSGKIDGHPLQELETDKKPKLRDQKDQTDGPVFLIEPERKLVISDQESNPSLRPEFRDQKPEHKDGPLSESERKQDLSDKESDPGLISEYRDQKDEHKDTPESDSERKPEPRDQESSSTGKPEFRESDSERKPEPRDQKPSSSGKPEFRGKDQAKAERSAVSKLKFHVYWPNATVPFYVNMDHFDRDQSLSIMTSLSVFAFKTCLKFAPALENPETFGHVLVFENPSGLRRCSISTDGHSMEGPHRVTLGYDCLRSPHIDMMIMRALGFPFEHNRFIRDNFIHVELDNVDPGSIQLFTKEATLPEELRFIPYDYDSVLHFGERDFSKNGHRTIIFKDANIQQNRVGLTPTDLRKLEIIYGPECRSRDRQEKIELCQSYPGVAQVRRKRHAEIEDPIEDMQLDRKKRHIDVDALDMMTPYDLDNSQIDRKKRHVEPEKLEAADKKPESDPITLQNLRVNRDITPPPEVVLAVPRAVDTILKELNIESNVQDLVENVYKISATALENVREKYCNRTKNVLRTTATEEISTVTKPDILGVVEVVANYANLIVERATQNLTAFCESSLPVEKYQRCGWNQNCVPSWKSTKTGDLFFSTQHRPYLPISTNYPPRFGHQYARSGNATEANNLTTTTEKARRKREIDEKDEKEDRSQTEYNDRKKIVLSALVNEIKSQKNDTQGSSSGETETTQATNVLEDLEEVNATKIGDAKPTSRKDDTATTNDDLEKKDGFDATSDPSDSTYPPNGTTKEDANIDGRKSASWVRVEGKEVRGKNKNPYKILEESSLSLEEENTRQPLKYKSKKQIHPGRNHITSNTEKPKGKDQRVDSQQHDKGRANIRHDEPKPKRRNAKPNVRLSDSAETEGRTKENSMEEKAPQQDYRNPQIQKQGKFLLHGER